MNTKKISENTDLLETHYVNRSNWIRAAVLWANDGIISTASLIVWVAAASPLRESIVLAAIAGWVAGALSMAAGEYVSVSSQTDIEKADIEREKKELEEIPEIEFEELKKIFLDRWLSPETAQKVCEEYTQKNALEAHMREELGITEISGANPFQAAFASWVSFTCGALMPILVAIFLPVSSMVMYQYIFAIIFLIMLGIISSKMWGTQVLRPIIRISFWGTAAMGASALVWYLFGVSV